MLCEGHTVQIQMINKWNKTLISGAISLIKHISDQIFIQ